jgi:hypothetical protein
MVEPFFVDAVEKIEKKNSLCSRVHKLEHSLEYSESSGQRRVATLRKIVCVHVMDEKRMPPHLSRPLITRHLTFRSSAWLK